MDSFRIIFPVTLKFDTYQPYSNLKTYRNVPIRAHITQAYELPENKVIFHEKCLLTNLFYFLHCIFDRSCFDIIMSFGWFGKSA